VSVTALFSAQGILNFDLNADPDPAFHSNADPYPASEKNRIRPETVAKTDRTYIKEK
jgi:hypothetical protein